MGAATAYAVFKTKGHKQLWGTPPKALHEVDGRSPGSRINAPCRLPGVPRGISQWLCGMWLPAHSCEGSYGMGGLRRCHHIPD